MYNIKKLESKHNKVFLIDEKYIIKNAEKEILSAEIMFLEKYKNLKVESIIKKNIKREYIVYKYIEGKSIEKIDDVENCINEIYKIVKQYRKVNVDGYGYIFDLQRTWSEFLRKEIEKKSMFFKNDICNMKDKVLKKIDEIEKFKIDKKLMHGDLGSFNIICNNKKISGIIDPRTLIGDPMYDFVYFLFSNYNITKDLNFINILNILEKEEIEKFFLYLYILLYDRIAIEEKNHTHTRKEFYNIWNEIEEMEKGIEMKENI